MNLEKFISPGTSNSPQYGQARMLWSPHP